MCTCTDAILTWPIFNPAKYMYFIVINVYIKRSYSTKAEHCTCVDTINCLIKPMFELANSICETYIDCWCPIDKPLKRDKIIIEHQTNEM